MIIRNQTKKTILSKSAILAKSFKEKAFGLILEKNADSMIFQTRFGIHTFFMKHPIDVLVLDKKNHVVVIKKNLKTNRIFVWNLNYDIVVELPAGKAKETNIDDEISYNT